MKVYTSLALMLSLFCINGPVFVNAADLTGVKPISVEVKKSSSIPIGTVVAWPVSSNPEDWKNSDGTFNWLECNGQTVSKTVYPELFALVGSHVPDFRGLFLRGFGQQAHTQINGSTVGQTTTTHKSGALGTVQGDAIRDPGDGDLTVISANNGITCKGPMCDGYESMPTNGDQWAGIWMLDQARLNPLKGLQQPMDNEIRPVNTAVRYLIRARS